MRATIITTAVLLGFSNAILAEDDPFTNFKALPDLRDSATNAAPNYVIVPESVPTLRISPEDVVQDSIQEFRFTTNKFAVRWTYTAAGAKKMLTFHEAHEGKKVRTVVGHFETQPSEFVFRPMPPLFTSYATWKEGWLKRRSTKIFCVSEDDAKTIRAGLKTK